MEGGGAKGAYQFGCLYALWENGAEFDAIAGTSVGALNAAIWSTRQMAWGKEFWTTISLEKVYPLRKPRVVFLPLAVTYGVLKKLAEWISQRPILAFLVGIMLAWYSCGGIAALFIIAIAGLISVITTGSFVMPGYIGVFLLMLLPSVPVIYILMVENSGLAAFTSRSLQTTLTDQLAGCAFEEPIFATVTRTRDIFDPDDMHYMSTGIPPSNPIILPQAKPTFVPEYVRADLQAEHTVNTLLATAALPYGIVPAIEGAIDGGLADNLPLFPLVYLDPCEVVLVIRVGSEEIPDADSVERLSGLERLQRLTGYDEGSAMAATWFPPPGFVRVDFSSRKRPAEERRPPPKMPTIKFIVRDPPKPTLLGDFINGTMNFSERYARLQFLKGFRHTRGMIRAGSLDNFIERRSERDADISTDPLPR